MKKISSHNGVSVRFRRWSRRAYSVFSSLGKAITIGNLSVQMAGGSLFRKVELIKLVVSGKAEKEDNLEDEFLLVLSESLLAIDLVNEVSGEYPAENNKYLYHLS